MRGLAAGKAAVPMLVVEVALPVPTGLCSLLVVQIAATIARSHCRHSQWPPVAVMVDCRAYPMARRLVVVTVLALAPRGPVLIFGASMLHPGPRRVGSLPRLQMARWKERHPIPRETGHPRR